MLEMSLFWVGVVLTSTAIIMLFLDLFQSKKIWALLSLVLVLPLLIHMLLNWSSLNVRKAFYILVIGLLAVLVSVSGGALSKLPFLQNHEAVQVLEDKIAPPEDTPLPNQQQADIAAESVDDNYDPLLTGSEYEQLETKEIVPEKVNKVARQAAPVARYEVINDDERIHAVNKRIRVIMLDGSVVEGKLTEIVDDSLLIEADVDGGSLGLSYKNEMIQSVAVRLVEGEKLYVPEAEELEQVSAEETVIDPEQPVVETKELQQEVQEESVQSVQDVVDDTVSDDSINDVSSSEVKQVPVPEALPTSAVEESGVESEVLKKVEEIVDDTKLLDNLNGQ